LVKKRFLTNETDMLGLISNSQTIYAIKSSFETVVETASEKSVVSIENLNIEEAKLVDPNDSSVFDALKLQCAKFRRENDALKQ
jgi:hypothetical protein